MLIKRLAAVCAAVTAMGAAMLSVSAEEIGTAGVYFADEDWLIQYWGGDADDSGNAGVSSVENAVITGDGAYTVSAKLDYSVSGIVFAALCTDIESGSCPDGMNVTIDSVEINGNAVDFGINGVPQWKDDGGYMRVNIYNTWSDDIADTAVSSESFSGTEIITVNFTVDGLENDYSETSAEEVYEAAAEASVEAGDSAEVTDEEEAEIPKSDNAEAVAETGNIPTLVLCAVGSWAAALALTARKRK